MTEWGVEDPSWTAAPHGDDGKSFGGGVADFGDDWGASANDDGDAEGWANAEATNDDGGPGLPKKQRVRKKDAEQLRDDRLEEKEKFISIWTRKGKGQPLILFMEKFPRDAATVFSTLWKKQIDQDGSKHAALILEDVVDTSPYERILDWINLCVDEGNDIKFPDIVDENPLHVLLDIIVVAYQIKVPEMSLQEQLKKQAIKYARKSLIDYEYIEMLYDENHPNYIGDSTLQEAGAASIFEAWWTRVLDKPEYDDYCSFLEQMRVKFPKLDEDLNGRFEEKKSFIEQKRAERKAERAAGAQNGGGGGGGGSSDGNVDSGNGSGYPSNDGADGGWGNAAAADAHSNGEWGADSATGGW